MDEDEFDIIPHYQEDAAIGNDQEPPAKKSGVLENNGSSSKALKGRKWQLIILRKR